MGIKLTSLQPGSLFKIQYSISIILPLYNRFLRSQTLQASYLFFMSSIYFVNRNFGKDYKGFFYFNGFHNVLHCDLLQFLLTCSRLVISWKANFLEIFLWEFGKKIAQSGGRFPRKSPSREGDSLRNLTPIYCRFQG